MGILFAVLTYAADSESYRELDTLSAAFYSFAAALVIVGVALLICHHTNNLRIVLGEDQAQQQASLGGGGVAIGLCLLVLGFVAKHEFNTEFADTPEASNTHVTIIFVAAAVLMGAGAIITLIAIFSKKE